MKDSKGVVPRHIAIIPDGNRRWAKEHGVSTYEGHQKGVDSFKTVVRHAADAGVQHISLWGMSVDNFTKRSPKEIADLLRIFRKHFEELIIDEDVHKRQMRVQVLGEWRKRFPAIVRKSIEKAEAATEHYTKYTLNVLLAYNGTNEMLQAVRDIAAAARLDKALQVTSQTIKDHLLTRDLPPVDLLIRTGGEPHLSAGFMMWDIADAELYFTEKYWPDFSNQDLDAALSEYAARRRKLGA